MFEPITLTLETPIQHGSETITQVVITRKPIGGDMVFALDEATARDGSTKQGTMVMALASRICDVPEPVLKKLDLPDFLKLSGVVSGFLPSGQ